MQETDSWPLMSIADLLVGFLTPLVASIYGYSQVAFHSVLSYPLALFFSNSQFCHIIFLSKLFSLFLISQSNMYYYISEYITLLL